MPSPFSIFSALINEDEEELPTAPPPPEDPGDDDDVMAHVKSAMTRIDEPVAYQGDTEQGYWIKKLSQAERGRGGKTKIANNTWVELTYEGGAEARQVGIRLHSTYVIRINSDNSCIVDTGGWSTVTTLDRINRYLPGSWFVYSVKGSWYWGNRSTGVGTYMDEQEGVRIPFQSGDKIDGQGVLHPQNAPEVRRVRPRKKMTRDEWDHRYDRYNG